MYQEMLAIEARAMHLKSKVREPLFSVDRKSVNQLLKPTLLLETLDRLDQ